jgi:SHOCT-like protein
LPGLEIEIWKESSMTTSEERMKILKSIQEGKVSPEQGAKLLSAMTGARHGLASAQASARGAGTGRWLRIKVTDTATGRSKASVQIPLGLIDAGMKIGARFAPDVEGADMSRVMEAVRAGTIGKIIDVTNEEDREQVEIYVE